jgi:hypothetical protein
MLDEVLHPGRIGVEVGVLGGVRCAIGPMRARIDRARRRPGVTVIDYAALADVALPEEAHVVVLDPPSSRAQTQWLRFHAADRHIHLVWTEHEVAFAQLVCDERWELRPLAQQLWPTLAAKPVWLWNAECEQALLGSDSTLRLPDAVADTLVALSELGFLRLDRDQMVVREPPERRRLEDAPRVIAATAQRVAGRDYLARAGTLDLFAAPSDLVAGAIV